MAQLEALVRQLGGDPTALAAPSRAWTFRVAPAGRRFGWKGVVYASDRATRILEVRDPGFAAALSRLAARDSVTEVF